MFRSYDHLQVKNILLTRITELTTDPLFYNIANIIRIVFLQLDALVDINPPPHHLISHTQQDANTQD
jgi:hypothetical protein